MAGGRTVVQEFATARDHFRRRVRITGPHGFEGTAVFALDDDPAVIASRVRETLEEYFQ